MLEVILNVSLVVVVVLGLIVGASYSIVLLIEELRKIDRF